MNTPPDLPRSFRDVDHLEDVMTAPSPALAEEFGTLAGDLIILGVGGKIGPTLARLAKRCVDEGLGRFEWTVLDWNKSAIDFYAAMGAPLNDALVPVRMTGEAIEKLARECP